MAQRLIVVGGNGFVGSNICRLGVSRSWDVHSISRSGKPWTTPKGHSPAWTKKVNWHAGSAFDPSTFSHLFTSKTAVVHTLGILFESNYKSGDVPGILSNIINRGPSNPLDPAQGKYEKMNRDSALSVFRSFQDSIVEQQQQQKDAASSSQDQALSRPPFVYLSAEDIFRPVIPSRYISTKRETESIIGHEATNIRSIFARPSLIYHPHLRPISTLPATLLDLSAKIFKKSPIHPSNLASVFPQKKSGIPHFTQSLANLLETPPIHVETVAEAICRAIEDPTTEGIIDVAQMRRLVGFKEDQQQETFGSNDKQQHP